MDKPTSQWDGPSVFVVCQLLLASQQIVLIGALLALGGAFAVMVWLVRRLRVPRRQAESGRQATGSLAALATWVEAHNVHATEHSPARVLVADDNPINQKVAVRMLESLGLRADVSANGREAVEMLRLLPYDLVLMAYQMPFMNGQEAATEIRKREPAGRHTPIIAVTSETGADCLDRCLVSGMDDVLLKPIRIQELMAALRRWLPANRETHLPVGRASRS